MDRRTVFPDPAGQAAPGSRPAPLLRGVSGNPFLLASPGGGRDRQLLTGDAVAVYASQDGWAHVRAARDGYCGWLPETALVPPDTPTHRVAVRTTWLLPAPAVREAPLADLHFGSRVRIIAAEGRWCRVAAGGIEGYLPSLHLKPVACHESDPVSVARLFLGTPYLWAGNTGFGIDCSGLVQAAVLACGHLCPGDSDLQEAALGRPLAPGEPALPGDLWFWTGHVAMVADPAHLIHATGHAMQVIVEPLADCVRRIAAETGPVRSRRRLAP